MGRKKSNVQIPDIQNDSNWKQIHHQILTPNDIFEYANLNIAQLAYDSILIKFDTIEYSFSTAEVFYEKVLFSANSNGGKEVLYAYGEKNKKMDSVVKSILSIVIEHVQKGHSDSTIKGDIYRGFKLAKKYMTKIVPSNIEEARSVLKITLNDFSHDVRSYKQSIERNIPKQGRSASTITSEQYTLLNLLQKLSNASLSEISQGFKLISKNRSGNVVDSLKRIEDIGLQFNFLTSMFRACSSIIINHTKLPSFVKTATKDIWISPSYGLINLLPDKDRVDNTNFAYWFNYENGNIKTLTPEIQKKIDDANEEYSVVRQRIIQLAIDCYFLHFMILTGQNDSVLASLPSVFADLKELDFKSDDSNMKTIKPRANHKNIKIQIQAEFIKDYKDFLKLRSYIIERESELKLIPQTIKDIPYLFFNFNVASNSVDRCRVSPYNLGGNAAQRIILRIHKKSPVELNKSKITRKVKGRWLRQNFGHEVSGYILQHSIDVQSSNYTALDIIETEDQFTDYFNFFNEKIISTVNVPDDTKDKSTPVGNCSSNYNPDFSFDTPDFAKKCGGVGCLFCSEYRLHDDEQDIRKLISLLFILDKLKDLAKDESHYDAVYGSTISRIQALLSVLVNKKPSSEILISEIKTSVFEWGELTNYWEEKAIQLENLGIITL
jgi:hypothetical protein